MTPPGGQFIPFAPSGSFLQHPGVNRLRPSHFNELVSDHSYTISNSSQGPTSAGVPAVRTYPRNNTRIALPTLERLEHSHMAQNQHRRVVVEDSGSSRNHAAIPGNQGGSRSLTQYTSTMTPPEYPANESDQQTSRGAARIPSSTGRSRAEQPNSNTDRGIGDTNRAFTTAERRHMQGPSGPPITQSSASGGHQYLPAGQQRQQPSRGVPPSSCDYASIGSTATHSGPHRPTHNVAGSETDFVPAGHPQARVGGQLSSQQMRQGFPTPDPQTQYSAQQSQQGHLVPQHTRSLDTRASHYAENENVWGIFINLEDNNTDGANDTIEAEQSSQAPEQPQRNAGWNQFIHSSDVNNAESLLKDEGHL